MARVRVNWRGEQSRVLLLSLPYALKLRMPNSRGAAGIRLL